MMNIIFSTLIIFFIIQYIQYKKTYFNGRSFKAILDILPVCVYIKDLKGNIIYSNKAFSNVTGYTVDELKKMNLKDIYTSEQYENILETDKNIYYSDNLINLKTKIHFKNNSIHNYWAIKSPIHNFWGKINGYMVILRDIDNEVEADQQKNSFVATLTHDLKTPTIAQINMLNLLIAGNFGKLTPKQEEMMGLVRCSCKYVSDLISTIIQTYCCDMGCIVLNPEKYDVLKLVNSLRTGILTLAEEKNQTIEVFCPHDEFWVYSDRLHIKRVIVNLISNAINHGFPNSTIKINLYSDDKQIYFSVENKSNPIPEEELAIIFEKFKKSKYGAFNKTGNGLGLYLSKQIIEMHNGKIYVESKADGTNIFGFSIPVKCTNHLESYSNELV